MNDQIVMFKFNNPHGEVTVAVRKVKDNYVHLYAGFSCLNPMDKGIPKVKRKEKALLTTLGRLNKHPTPIPFPKNMERNKPLADQRKGAVQALLEYMRNFETHNLGFKHYAGEPERSSFHKWFRPFIEHYSKDPESSPQDVY